MSPQTLGTIGHQIDPLAQTAS